MGGKRLTQVQIDTALLWLRSNEGWEGGEREACEAVADWIEHQTKGAAIRSVARKAKVPVSYARRFIADRGL